MQSSVGPRSLQLRLQLWLAAVALVALALSLVLAFAVATAPRFATRMQPHETAVNIPIAAPVSQSTVPANAVTIGQPQSLWTLLVPWVIGVDAVAVLGLAVVLVVLRNAQRRRGSRI